jgi:hypothetical protein
MPETNSSSSHSLAIFKTDQSKKRLSLTLDKNDNVIIPNYTEDYGSFGWGWDYILDPGLRACYLFSCICGLFSGKKLKEKRDKFENIIKNYTGAKNILYEWALSSDKTKNIESKIKSFAPSVDHQSISDMFKKIWINDDSIRDFIFSNQSHLIIGGEDTPPLDILCAVNPEGTYNTEVRVKIPGGNDLVSYFHEWPGGGEIRSVLENLSSHIIYSSKNNKFEISSHSSWYFLGNKDHENDYIKSVIFHEINKIRFFKNESGIIPTQELDYSKITDYKELDFEIIRK